MGWKWIVAAAAAAGVGCATTPPKELADAREVYERASEGAAGTLAPVHLHQAKQVLDKAERSWKRQGDPSVTRDLAYIAKRQAQLAESVARAQQNEGAQRQAVALLEQHGAQQQLTMQQEQLSKTQAELEAEQQRIQQLEMELQQIAETREEPRGLVLTLPGGLLFAFDKSDLLPSSQRKLDELAEALKKVPTQQRIEIEGHADARGPQDYNEQLSFLRAQAVEDYLVSRGVNREQFEVRGFGESRPIADNRTAEGRANNRRVEIVIQQPEQGVGGAGEEGSPQVPDEVGAPDAIRE